MDHTDLARYHRRQARERIQERTNAAAPMRYRLVKQSGEEIGPHFARYVDAFNYRQAQPLAYGARILEL